MRVISNGGGMIITLFANSHKIPCYTLYRCADEGEWQKWLSLIIPNTCFDTLGMM